MHGYCEEGEANQKTNAIVLNGGSRKIFQGGPLEI